MIDVLRGLQKDDATQHLAHDPIELETTVSPTVKPTNIFEVLECEDWEEEDRLESLATISEANSSLQAPLTSPYQATDEKGFIKGDSLADTIETFFTILVRHAVPFWFE